MYQTLEFEVRSKAHRLTLLLLGTENVNLARQRQAAFLDFPGPQLI
jgi:hypothetical protein